jgi:hypothetical protein
VNEGGGVALGVAAAILAFFATLAFVIVVLMFVFLFVYSIVKGFGPATANPSATTVLIGVVAIVGALTVGFTGTLALIGKSLTPRKRKAGRD